MKNAFLEYYRCHEGIPDLQLAGKLGDKPAFFPVDGIACYGRNILRNDIGASISKDITNSCCFLPFDPDEIVANCRYERYIQHNHADSHQASGIIRKMYYAARPFMPVPFRKHLQRIALRGWQKTEFPRWPVDLTVDTVMREVFSHILKTKGNEKLPFIWFWPDGYQSCLIMTHDVEAKAGRDFCSELMNIDDSFGIKSSFQVVPEKRYEVPQGFLAEIRKRGFEVNIHGLNHDGKLFDDYEEFKKRAVQINQYAKSYQALGFRSPVMYRNADWMRELDFDYDMSFPNVAHLDPQHGGCATIMPYFIGNMVELPLTMLQDYSVFHFLREKNIDLWRRQIDTVMQNNGLISFIIHPDYIIEKSYRRIYESLLNHLRSMIQDRKTLCLLPREASAWWRQRSKMHLVCDGGQWRIEGEGSERAKIAHAFLANGKVLYQME